MIKRPSWRMDRGDAVLTRVLLLALAVGYPALALLPSVVHWIGGAPLRLITAVSTDAPIATGLAGADAEARFDQSVVWTVQHPSAGQWLADLAPALVTWALLLVGCGLADRLVRSTVAGEPFGAVGVRRMRGLALVVIGYAVLVPVAHNLADLGVLWSVDRVGALALVIDVAAVAVPIVIGIFVLVLAEAFAIGQRLADDVEGLV